jgi:hypothetical protein
VTYVFLGRVNARSFLARFTPADVISTLVAPLTHSAYAPASSVLQPLVETKQLETTPKSGIILKDEWLEMILSGQQIWEIRSMRTHKRERVALAQSGAPVLLGDVEIIGCVKIDDLLLRANIKKHGVPLHRHAEIVSGYKNIFAWELARPRRYKMPILYTRAKGQMTWIDLVDQQRIFANVRFVIASVDDAGPQISSGELLGCAEPTAPQTPQEP